jgi:hypothetical protein
MNNRSIEGAAAVAASAAAQRQASPSPLRIFPLPTRFELAETERYQRSFEFAKEVFSKLTQHIGNHSKYWSDVAVPYIPAFAFTETVAASVGRHASDGLLDPLARLTSYLTDGKVPVMFQSPRISE